MPYLKTLCSTYLPYKLHLVNVILALFITKDYELYDRSLSNMVSGYLPPHPPSRHCIKGPLLSVCKPWPWSGGGTDPASSSASSGATPILSSSSPPPLTLLPRVFLSTLQKCNSSVITLTAKTLSRKFVTIQIFPEMKLRGLVPSSYIHVSVSRYIYCHDRSAYSAEGK